MGIFKKIFTGPEAVESAMDGVKKGIDKMWFTKEERAEVDGSVREFFLKYLQATQPQNLARRYIAFAVVGLWVLLVMLCVVTWPFSSEYSTFVMGVLTGVVTVPFSGIMAFYFLTHLARGYSDAKKDK